MEIIGGVLLRFRLQSLLLSFMRVVSCLEKIVVADLVTGLELSM